MIPPGLVDYSAFLQYLYNIKEALQCSMAGPRSVKYKWEAMGAVFHSLVEKIDGNARLQRRDRFMVRLSACRHDS